MTDRTDSKKGMSPAYPAENCSGDEGAHPGQHCALHWKKPTSCPTRRREGRDSALKPQRPVPGSLASPSPEVTDRASRHSASADSSGWGRSVSGGADAASARLPECEGFVSKGKVFQEDRKRGRVGPLGVGSPAPGTQPGGDRRLLIDVLKGRRSASKRDQTRGFGRPGKWTLNDCRSISDTCGSKQSSSSLQTGKNEDKNSTN
ncbi:EKC/KEOPS complex subunit TPRKB isoform X2 [Mustela putorius furo]|uniref:EKC/KEOPS complex subunit TPRKB isoform X2 n=1 Tax=Mustela putorius furo TaxID=9669 RepID=A0A8U0V006_MUSPF|nr:EKC/KEOPS complex subunit TPRKB isoform X2 [Mustela putorius furo]